ncbi:unnamed protein product [Gadus morhua 'NCC']
MESPWTVGRFAWIKPETPVVEVVPADTGEATVAAAAVTAAATGGDVVAEEDVDVDSRMAVVVETEATVVVEVVEEHKVADTVNAQEVTMVVGSSAKWVSVS